MLQQSRLSTFEEIAPEIEESWDASLLQLVKALRKVPNLMECHTALEKVLARNATEKCTKDSENNPSAVSSNNLVDIAIGVGESAIRKNSVGLNKST